MNYKCLICVKIYLFVIFEQKFVANYFIIKTELNNSRIFDSFYKLTDLEEFPYVCAEFSNEICAENWINEVDKVFHRNENRLANIEYKYSTNMNKINEELKTKFNTKRILLMKEFIHKAHKFQWKKFQSKSLRRIFQLLSHELEMKNETRSKVLIDLNNEMSNIYNNAIPCFRTCLGRGENDIVELFRTEKDYEKLAGYWVAWNNVTGTKMRQLFVERVKLNNKTYEEYGLKDQATEELKNDFEEENFDETILKLYYEILPFYQDLHAYVRYCLARFYPGKFDKYGSIPAHIFGNVWAQQWTNIFPIIKQCQKTNQSYNYQNEAAKTLGNYSVKKMFKLAEEFYESIGMHKMTDYFWKRSMFIQPIGKTVDCHGSAINFFNKFDFRIKMCTLKTFEDFTVIHHEMGHIQYFKAYRNLNFVFQESANLGFHEAIGDTIALAVKTPEHLKKIGLISKIPESEDFDIDYLMATALEKVVFLPFALTMDSFIWGVYNGSVSSSNLNQHWWNLRHSFQGIKPPVERSENDFDPGAKYHIVYEISYIRYFFSFIVQFQFYESLCNISGHKGVLHRCDFYQSKKSGGQLLKMLEKGKSVNWRKSLNILTKTNNIQTDSLLKFFHPLIKWLKLENKKLNIPVGW